LFRPPHRSDPRRRDEIAQEILRYGDVSGNGWADVIDTLTIYPDVRRQAVRILAEVGGRGRWAV